MNNSQHQIHQKPSPSQNADIEYIIDLFDSQQLRLTITEDKQQNQRSSSINRKRSDQGLDFKQQITDDKYRGAFLQFFKTNRTEAVDFIDSAIRFMNCIKKMKLDDLLSYLSNENAFQTITETLITPQLLVDPIQEELSSGYLSERDTKLYQEALKILKDGELTIEAKGKIQRILGQVQGSH